MDAILEFHEAVYRGALDDVVGMLEADATLARSAGEHGKTGLHWAAESDQASCARILLNAGADLEARASWGASPFDWAATMGSRRVADLLLSLGASGLTVIAAAALGMYDEVSAVLREGGNLSEHVRRDAPSSPNDHWPSDSAHLLGDVIGDALYAGARNGHTETVELLLDSGGAINAKGVFGGTGLHWAAMHGHAATVKRMVFLGADRRLLDDRFKASPAQWAEEGGHPELAILLAGSE